MSARELLDEFTESGEQPPFEEIVRRYAGMVYNVCLRITKDGHDAEDATQAVFLALAAQVKAGKPVRYIGPWLQQVARRLSLDIRRSHARRKRREERVAEMNGTHGTIGSSNGVQLSPSDGSVREEMRRVLTEELHRLPAKYRMPLILHYFGGMTREEMSKELGIKPNTLGVRVFRGRELLAKRLADRGIVMAGGVLALWLTDLIRSSMSDTLVQATSVAATQMYVGHDITGAVISSQVIGLARGVARAMRLAKIKAMIVAVMLSLSAVAGAAEAISRVAPIDISLPSLRDVVRSLRDVLRFDKPSFTSTQDLPPTQARPDEIDRATQPWPTAPEPPVVTSPRPTRPGDHAKMLASAQPVVPVGQLLPAPLPPLPMPASPSRTLQTFQGALDWTKNVKLPRPAASSASMQAMGGGGGARPAEITSGRSSRATHGPGGTQLNGIPLQGGIHAPTARAFGVAPSTVDRYSLDSGRAMLSPGGVTVGQSGFAAFEHTRGVHDVEGSLVLGAQAGGSGLYTLDDGGKVTAENVIVGQGGSGKFVQSSGSNVVDQTLYIGYDDRGAGFYALSGDGQVSAKQIQVGADGTGYFVQTGGTSTANNVIIASGAGSTGSYLFEEGILRLTGTPVTRFSYEMRTGGSAYGDSIVDGMGGHVASTGALVASPVFAASVNPVAVSDSLDTLSAIYVGGAGAGTLKLGDASKYAQIVEARPGSSLVVRSVASGAGQVRGWGTVGITGQLINNGRIVADGYGVDHALDLSSASSVANTIENRAGQANGWFATAGGELVLPPLSIRLGDGTYTWGESAGDPTLDLVNSVRLTLSDVTDAGELSLSLVALDRDDLPPLPVGHKFIGAWRVDASEITFGDMDVLVRYDDTLADQLNIDESNLKLWTHDETGWHHLPIDQIFRDTEGKIIGGKVGSNLDFLGVSAPEPGAVGVLVLGAWMLLRRRR